MRDAIVPGNSRSLWKAVKVAKDVNHNQLPKTLLANHVKINEGNTADVFASNFDKKKLQMLSAQLSSMKMFTTAKIKSILE